MHESPSTVPQPAQPPDLPAHFSIYPYQLVGFTLLFLIPILALFGVFGETMAVVESTAGGIAMRVEYPNRVLLMGHGTAYIKIQNTTTEMLTITVSVEKAFLHNYSDIVFTPDLSLITGDAWIVTLDGVQPGETRVIVMESRGKIAGGHRGTITAHAGDQSTSVDIETIILP